MKLPRKKKVNRHYGIGIFWTVFIPVFSVYILQHQAMAREKFNPQFLQAGSNETAIADLSVFENEQSQAPGDYTVDIWLNNHFLETRTLSFTAASKPENSGTLLACLSLAQLKHWGVRTEVFAALHENSDGCVDVTLIPQASTSFNFQTQQLLLSIPQAALHANARGFVSPDKYDEGITALLLNYRFTGADNHAVNNRATNSSSQYLNLRPGINMGAWRLRNYTTWIRSSHAGGKGKWDVIYTRLQRNIVPLKAQLTLGESSSPSTIFESVPFLGAQLASDDEMLPESLRGYAPVVQGTARTHAQVIIRQNGYIIYQSYVSPGAFAITDLYATGGSGDLYVTVKEADGSEQYLVVPYASLPLLVREGQLKYSVTTGRYRPYVSTVAKRHFAQVTVTYGLPWSMTLYGGIQAAADYQALAFGIGKNFGKFGAFSTDIINARATTRDSVKHNGQSLRVRYSKNFYQTGTNFAIAGYRYSTRDYYSLPELMDSWRPEALLQHEQARNRTELTLAQNLGRRAGSLSVSLLREDYWQTNRRLESFTGSYNTSYNSVSYGISYSVNRHSASYTSQRYSKDRVVSFNVSLPLNRWMSNTWANYTLASNKPGYTSQSVGLSGMALENNNLSWSARQGYTSQGGGNSGSLEAGYRGTYGEITTGYSYDQTMRRLNYGLEGGLLVHKDGATLSQTFGDTAALVIAPGADDVSIVNHTGVRTDFRGYTLVPNLTPYRLTDIILDTTTLPDDVDLNLSTQSVVPGKGAIVRARFSAQVGNRGVMTLTYKGRPVPFGAIVTEETSSDQQSNIVGDEGQVYLNGLKPQGHLLVQWGKSDEKKCRVAYVLPTKKAPGGIHTLYGVCQ